MSDTPTLLECVDGIIPIFPADVEKMPVPFQIMLRGGHGFKECQCTDFLSRFKISVNDMKDMLLYARSGVIRNISDLVMTYTVFGGDKHLDATLASELAQERTLKAMEASERERKFKAPPCHPIGDFDGRYEFRLISKRDAEGTLPEGFEHTGQITSAGTHVWIRKLK